MSLVEVSPSTLTILKVSCTSEDRAFCSISGAMAQSVVRKTSMVAILGWIIPEPLAIPPRRQATPPTVNSTATSFMRVSVVMIPSAASAEWSPRPAASSGIPLRIGSISRGWPITPVEATTTSSGEICRASAVKALILSAISIPSALQVLAFPLLQITA